MKSISNDKSRARLQAKQRRAAAQDASAGAELIRHFPAARYRSHSIGGFWPLAGEIDILPLLRALHEAGHELSLPCTPRVGKPLTFRLWSPGEALKSGSFGTREPYGHKPEIQPTLLLMPLLAFTANGDRLGYGGGFYDRTIETFHQSGNVFTCGVAYAAQEAVHLPTGPHDQRLDAILTETGFKAF